MILPANFMMAHPHDWEPLEDRLGVEPYIIGSHFANAGRLSSSAEGFWPACNYAKAR